MENQERSNANEDDICVLFEKLYITETKNFVKKPNVQSNTPTPLPKSHGNNEEGIAFFLRIQRIYRELRQNINELETKLALLSLSRQVEIESIKVEFENEKSELSNHIEKQAKESHSMSDQFNSLNALLKSNEEELEKRSLDLKRLENEKSALEGKVVRLEARLSQLEEQNETKSKENLKLMDEKNELASKLDELSLRTNMEKKKIKEKFQASEARIKSEYEKRLKDTTNAFNEKLKNLKIDVNSLKDKLAESLKYCRASREKLQLAREKRHEKKKVSNCVTVLSRAASSVSGSAGSGSGIGTVGSSTVPLSTSTASPSTLVSPTDSQPQKKRRGEQFKELRYEDLLDEDDQLSYTFNALSSSQSGNRLKASITKTRKN